MVDTWRDVLRNSLVSDGLSADADRLLGQIEKLGPQMLAALAKHDPIRAALSSKPMNEQEKSCGLMTGFIQGDGHANSPSARI